MKMNIYGHRVKMDFPKAGHIKGGALAVAMVLSNWSNTCLKRVKRFNFCQESTGHLVCSSVVMVYSL